MRLNYGVEPPKSKRFRLCKIQAVVQEFVKSGKAYAKVEIDNGEYKSVKSAYGVLRQSVKALGLGESVKVKWIDGTVWMLNLPLMEKDGGID